MTQLLQIRKSLRRRFVSCQSTLLMVVLHVVTVSIFIAMLVVLRHWLPHSASAADLEGAMQLLAQVLALVVGVLLLGTTVSLASYDDAVSLNAIHGDLEKATAPFFVHFFSGGRRAHKLDRAAFRRWILRKAKVETLQFFDRTANAEDGWFIYRPNWDGVWFQVAESPFANSSRANEQNAQIQALHEAAICAYTVLRAVSNFRSSGSALLTHTKGTNGSRWFLEGFERHIKENGQELPHQASFERATKAISLALSSEHYMQEEFREHANNLDWGPYVLTNFQLNYVEYCSALLHLLAKLQLLRWSNLEERHPTRIEGSEQRLHELLFLPLIETAKDQLAGLRSRVTAAHGAAKYFYSIKRSSVPGIGISLLVLIGLLCGWPLLKLAADAQTRSTGFILLYSAGIAALLESSWFLTRLLWKRRTAG